MEIQPIKNYNKTLTPPADKSITHRAVLFNALSGGKATVYKPLLGEDCLSTVDCMRRLGVAVEVTADAIRLSGGEIRSADLYAGNSGTTMRLLTGALCGYAGKFTLTGDASLGVRPMKRVATPLESMGANIALTDGHAPITVTGAALHGIAYASPIASAQVKSAVLLAGLKAEGKTSVTEPSLSRDHTERMLQAMGADIAVEGLKVTVGKSKLHPVDVTVCGDISAATYPLVLAACVGGRATVKRTGINPTRDGVLEVLRAAGVDVSLDEVNLSGEPTADITVRNRAVKPFTVGGDLIPRLIDELPALGVLACFIEGTSVIRDAAELKVKESDRIATTVEFLRSLGGDVTPTDDGMIIVGHGFLPGGGTVDPKLDHRTAMAAAIAMAASRKGGTLLNPNVCAVSYPDFYKEVLGQ